MPWGNLATVASWTSARSAWSQQLDLLVHFWGSVGAPTRNSGASWKTPQAVIGDSTSLPAASSTHVWPALTRTLLVTKWNTPTDPPLTLLVRNRRFKRVRDLRLDVHSLSVVG